MRVKLFLWAIGADCSPTMLPRFSDSPNGGMISELLAEHYFVINLASIISKSFEAPLTINTIINERHVNPIRIVFITKLPNELIKL